MRSVRTAAIVSLVAVGLVAACSNGGGGSSEPAWKSWGFDGAGAGGSR